MSFIHGLGDAVQFTVVLNHLEPLGWKINLQLRNRLGIFGNFCREFGAHESPRPRGIASAHQMAIHWPDPDRAFAGSPSTKAERCLREVFGIEPQLHLCKYRIFPQDRRELVGRFVCDDLQGRPFVLLHYRGNSARPLKHPPESTILRAAKRIIDMGRVPVLLDWESRSQLLENPWFKKWVVHPDINHPLWLQCGTGDPSSIAALAKRADLCIGIDSGPGHLFGASGANSLIVWVGHHPVHYYGLCRNATHLVPENHYLSLRGTAEERECGKLFFLKHYEHRTYHRLEHSLPEAIAEHLERCDFIADGDCWVRREHREPDMIIVRDVYQEDCYQIGQLSPPARFVVDVGSHIGAFSVLCRRRSGSTRIACVEANAGNLECLRRNVDSFATVFHGACTYEPGDVGIASTVFEDSSNTGGSTVLPVGGEGWDSRRGDPRYQLIPDPLPKWTLEAIRAKMEWPRIDLLKLDCEGSEYSILRNADLKGLGVKVIVGEYHGGQERFQQLIQDRFATGWKVEVLKGGHIGLFRIRRQ